MLIALVHINNNHVEVHWAHPGWAIEENVSKGPISVEVGSAYTSPFHFRVYLSFVPDFLYHRVKRWRETGLNGERTQQEVAMLSLARLIDEYICQWKLFIRRRLHP